MSKLPWRPWSEVVELRPELRVAGELAMNLFAADLYAVVKGEGPEVYRNPKDFFALTYPTFALRELVKDVLQRLDGQTDAAIRQLELTYGGGKTHTLLTLYHLVRDPDRLPDLPAVTEFVSHAGRRPPRTQVAILPFDKLDVEKGMEVIGPAGERRQLRMPWSVLAFQLAGADGLRYLHADGQDQERETPPAEPLLVDLLDGPRARNGLSTLVLIDETLMYVREKASSGEAWRSRLIDFFQYLTQAAVKARRCAVVASLLATDPRKSDKLGLELVNELYDIFRRQNERTVQPVQKEDVAEVLRRRFFTPESTRDKEAFRPHVSAALKGAQERDDATRREGKAAENRFFESYPFHPDLTEVFYTKWTQLPSFQKTRGVLRTFAMALRQAERFDTCPLIGPGVFLNDPGKDGLSEAARELASVAATAEHEGRRQEWTAILEGELAKARVIQAQTAGVDHREVEQAVFAAFLHSQPSTQKATTRDLMLLLAPTRPDRIELEKALRRWADESWFLDEEGVAQATSPTALPPIWRLGGRPNLRQMHHYACDRVPADLVDEVLLREVRGLKALTEGAREAGAGVHNLPDGPGDVKSDGELRYAVLGPSAASASGAPSAEARRFLDEVGPGNPRVYRNAVVLAVPAREALEAMRDRVRRSLAWEQVRKDLASQELDPIREEALKKNLADARREVPRAIRQAYCIVVTVSRENEAHAFKINPGEEPLFEQIRKDERSRIRDEAISAEAMLPGGPYSIWQDEPARRVKDLTLAFAQQPRLPKMLRSRGIADTLVQGMRDGLFVLRLARPDRSAQTWWRQPMPEAAVKEAGLEVVLPEHAELTDLAPELLAPGALPGLWSGAELSVGALGTYFAGGHVVQVPREGYEEPVTIPRVSREALEEAIRAAVQSGQLWLTADGLSLWSESMPAGGLAEGALLQAPPQPVLAGDLVPEHLPGGWQGEETTGRALRDALSSVVGKPLPWPTVRQAIDDAFRSGLLERAQGSGPWPCDLAGATLVRVRQPVAAPPARSAILPEPQPSRSAPGTLVANAELRARQIEDLVDLLGDLQSAAVGHELKFRLRVELSGTAPEEVVRRLNELLAQVSEGLKLT